MDGIGGAQIIGILVVLLVLALFLLPFLLFFVYVFYQNSKRKKIRNRVLSATQQFAASHRVLPVRYSSEGRFKAWWKIFPWEGAGLLFVAPGVTHFFGEKNSGQPLELHLTPANSRANWLGKCPWPNGAVSWFEIQTPTEKHYFSSETGPFIFGSEKSTRGIYDEMNGNLLSA